jgi:hypothetical protein
MDALLQSQRVVPIDRFLAELEVSRATFKRDLEYLRDRLNAPIVWDREAWGYRYETAPASGQHALPGLWFNASEAHALLLMQAMLSELQPTLLKSHIAPLRARLRAVLESGQHSAEEVERRLRELAAAAALPLEAVLVLGQPDPLWGQRLAALVRARSGADVRALVAGLQQAAAVLPPSQRPRHWRPCPGLAPTAVGKWERGRWGRWLQEASPSA